MDKLITLGNEFIEGDTLAKEIGELLKDEFEIIPIKDSFQLMTVLNETENPIILDVVQNLQEPKIIPVENLRNDSILSAHDFDAGYAIKLVDKPVKIVGIPMQGDAEQVKQKVLQLLNSN